MLKLVRFRFTLLGVLLSQLLMLVGNLPNNLVVRDALDQLIKGFVHALVGKGTYLSEWHALQHVAEDLRLYDALLCLTVFLVAYAHLLRQVLILVFVASPIRILVVPHYLNYFT